MGRRGAVRRELCVPGQPRAMALHRHYPRGETAERGGVRRCVKRRTLKKRFKVGDHVTWNSEPGRVSGRSIKVHTQDAECKGHRPHTHPDTPKYEIESDK